MKSLLFVYNSNAGKGLVKGKVVEVLDIFVKAGYLPTVYPTQGYKDGYKMVRHMKESYDLIVCSGGDGTLDEIVTAMVQSHLVCPLGYIPAGSTNDFARSLHISRNLLEAADDAVNGEEFRCDIGDFNGDIFVYIAAFGMFTDVSYATSQDVKNVLGHLAYVLEGIKRIYNIPAYNMKITYQNKELQELKQQRVLEGQFMFGMVTNSKSVGGVKNIVGKKVVFDDGEFEVTLIRKPKNIIELQEIVAALVIEQIDSKYMESFKVSSITFESNDEVAWTLDGEYGGSHNFVKVYNRQQALSIMVNPEIEEEIDVEEYAVEDEFTLEELSMKKLPYESQ